MLCTTAILGLYLLQAFKESVDLDLHIYSINQSPPNDAVELISK